MVSEEKREEVKKEARQILERFSKELGKVKIKEKSLKGKVGGFRKEGSGEEGDKEFIERVFSNAPKKEGDFIVAEKKKW